MGIRKRIIKRKRLRIHEHKLIVNGLPRSIAPNVMAPTLGYDNKSIKLSPVYGENRVYIGHVQSFHRPYYINVSGNRENPRHSSLKEIKPWSGSVGYAVWVLDRPLIVEAIPNKKDEALDLFEWKAADKRGRWLENVCTMHRRGWFDFQDCVIDGGINYEFLDFYTADQDRAENYWDNEAYQTWPDWLHRLEASAYRALYKAAEERFKIKLPWGVFKGTFL